jgi:hypothetical protein
MYLVRALLFRSPVQKTWWLLIHPRWQENHPLHSPRKRLSFTSPRQLNQLAYFVSGGIAVADQRLVWASARAYPGYRVDQRQ